MNTFTGNWERKDIEYTAKGAQKAGFDLVEGMRASLWDSAVPTRICYVRDMILSSSHSFVP